MLIDDPTLVSQRTKFCHLFNGFCVGMGYVSKIWVLGMIEEFNVD